MSFKDGLAAESGTVFFNSAEFCTPILHSGVNSVCYFDKQWIELDGDEAGVSVHTPTALIHKGFMPTLAVGDAVTIETVTYTVRDMQYDRGETGDVLLVLSDP